MDFISVTKGAKIRKTIHLIRHGQTDYNRQNIIQGSGIDSDLNQTGKLQAAKFYSMYKNQPYQHIYTSELKRSIQSVDSFIQSGLPHSSLEAFNEINWGIMEGQLSSQDNLAKYHSIVNSWSSGKLDIAIEGGETPEKMYERQKIGLDMLMQKSEEELILICMHGRALRSFLCLLTGAPLREMEKWPHSNLCLYELEFNSTHFNIVKQNDISHL